MLEKLAKFWTYDQGYKVARSCAGSLQQAESSPRHSCDSLVVLLEKAVNNIMTLFAREVQSEQNRVM